MRFRSVRAKIASALMLLAGGCGSWSPTELYHENFKEIMQHQVGRSTSHPQFVGNQYPERLVATRTLASSNTELEFKFSRLRDLECHTFFEIDRASQTVVAWRYEGTKRACSIPW